MRCAQPETLPQGRRRNAGRRIGLLPCRPSKTCPRPPSSSTSTSSSRNIANMQARARAAGVKLRPHAKTHKSPEVGRMQIAAGASGLTLAKTSEAEVFAAHGFEDIFLGYPVVRRGQGAAPARPRRPGPALGRRRQRRRRGSLGDVFHAAGRRLPVLLKIDCGFHRVGVSPSRREIGASDRGPARDRLRRPLHARRPRLRRTDARRRRAHRRRGRPHRRRGGRARARARDCRSQTSRSARRPRCAPR